jgi:pimeloyl-ACP methyl ester carboxylesterase
MSLSRRSRIARFRPLELATVPHRILVVTLASIRVILLVNRDLALTPSLTLKGTIMISHVQSISLLASCTAALLLMSPHFASAQSSPLGVKNIVLVHGAFADGSSWAKVIPLLEAEGYHVVAVQNPLTSLADDVAATKRILALQDGPTILVGHSWGRRGDHPGGR